MTQTAGGEREGRVVGRIPEDTYARRLMLARDVAGRLSIREAADKCGINYGTWAGWERGAGSRTFAEDTRTIADALGVDLDWLRDGGPLPAPERRTVRARSSGHRGPYAARSVRPGSVRLPRRARRLDGSRRVAA